MKSIIIVVTVLFSSTMALAQVEFYGQDIPKDLKETTLCAVMTGTEAYQAQLKHAVEQYWTYTDFQFIDEATFEEYKSDSDYSFFYIHLGEVNGYPTDFFTLGIGNKKKDARPLALKELIVDKKKINADEAHFVHLYVQHIQRYVKAVEEGKVTERAFSDRWISEETYRIQEMPLLVKESDFDPTIQDAAKRKDIYHGELEVAGQERINTAIAENESVAVVDVIMTGERRNRYCYKRVYDASTGEMLYRDDEEALYGKNHGLVDDDLKSIDRAR